MRIKNFKLNSDDQVIVKITGEILRAFHIETVDADSDADFDGFEIANEVAGDKVTTQLVVEKSGGRQRFKAGDFIRAEERRGAEIHRLVKKNLYRILTGDLKLAGVPYGIMHGVRPTKIVHRWIRAGYGVTKYGVIDREKIASRLRTDYLTSREKSWLLTEVAVRQLPILSSGDEKLIGVYVGIPFCVTRCLYCSFPSNVLPDDEKVAEFMAVLTKDLSAAAAEIQRYGFKVQSIYIGGGTPTALPEQFFAEMMDKVTAAFYGDSVEEFTVECGRPDTITREKIAVMKNCHVTRVSVNPQTMNQQTLDRIGRRHSIEQVLEAFNELRVEGDWKINMDLILGLPGENLDDVKDTVRKVLALNPDDVTLHALAIKRGSALQTQLADEVSALEDFELPSDAEVRRMSDAADKFLRAKGYAPYYLYRQGYISGQIENIGYCRRGAEGIYNIQIMDERQTIIGVGAAASTKVPDNENMRLQSAFHAKDLTTYLRDIDKYIDNRAKVLAEIYTPVEEINATVEEIPAVEVQAEPVDEIPAVEVPAEPVEEISAVEVQAEPVEEIPAVEVQAEPVEEIPAVEVQAEPVEEIPAVEVQAEPVEENPAAEVQAEPVEENPAAEVQTEPVEEIPADEVQAEPVEEIPADEVQAEPVEEIPAAEIQAEPVEEIPAAEIPAEPVEEIPADEIPAEPVEEIPAAEVQAEPVEEIPAPEPPVKPKKSKKSKRNA